MRGGYKTFFSILSLFLFCLCGIFYVLNRHQLELSFQDLTKFDSLFIYAAFILALLIYPADALRYKINAHAMGLKLDWKSALEVSVVNFFFSWITPAAIMGIPASVYYFKKKGMSIEQGTVLASGKSFLGVGILLFSTFIYSVFSDLKLIDNNFSKMLFVGGGIYVGIVIIPIILAFLPASSQMINYLKKAVAKKNDKVSFIQKSIMSLEKILLALKSLLKGGLVWGMAIFMTHLIYYAIFLSVGVVLTLGLKGIHETTDVWQRMAIFLSGSLVAPTPGGAGIAEAMVEFIFSPPLTIKEGLLVCIVYRTLTFYLQVGVGAVWLSARGILNVFWSHKKQI